MPVMMRTSRSAMHSASFEVGDGSLDERYRHRVDLLFLKILSTLAKRRKLQAEVIFRVSDGSPKAMKSAHLPAI